LTYWWALVIGTAVILTLIVAVTGILVVANRQLRKEHDFTTSILDTTGALIAVLDNEGNIVQFNKACETLTGYQEHEVVGQRLRNFLFEAKELESANAIFHNQPAYQFPIDFESIWVAKDGTHHLIACSTTNLEDDKGNIQWVLFTGLDITERKQVEQEVRKSQEQLRNLAAHLQSIREEERTLIAREIHDELGQALTALKMDIAWLNKKLPPDQQLLLDKIKAMSHLIDSTTQTVKKISSKLRPGLLDDLGLVAAIEWQSEEFMNRTGIKCDLTLLSNHTVLDRDRSTALFRIFQETLTNIACHAAASKIEVRLQQNNDRVTLIVTDNGIGIAEQQISSSSSLGLIGMRERAYVLGGEVKIQGIKGKGTTVTVTLPLSKEENTMN